ncbi:unnamed protein product [Camellia sinensis]
MGSGGFTLSSRAEADTVRFTAGIKCFNGDGSVSGLFREHLHPSLPLELRQKRSNDMYMHQNIQGKMFTDGSRYTIPRQEHFSNANTNVQDWAINTNTTHMSAPVQSHLDGGELGRNWFSGEHRVRGGWSTLDTSVVGPTQTVINRSSNPDQSLFGIVSQCNEVRSGAPYDSMGSTEKRFIQSGSYGRVGAVVPTASNMLPPTAHPLDYLSGHEAAAPVKNNNIRWMSSVPHQNSALHDSMGKPFLRPRVLEQMRTSLVPLFGQVDFQFRAWLVVRMHTDAEHKMRVTGVFGL